MGLRIVIGFDAQKTPSVVYVGGSGSEANEAMEKDKVSERFEVFSNVTGVRKSNPNAPSRTASVVVEPDPTTPNPDPTEPVANAEASPKAGRRKKAV